MSNTAWDSAARLADKHASAGSIFIRLVANGDKVVGAFCGEPFAREVVWTGERYETFDPQVHTDKRPSLRVMLNFFVPEDSEMKVIEGGTTWFRDVLKVRDKYGLDKWLFEIERHGDAGDPKTTYSILPEEKINAAMRARIAEAELHDLASLSTGEEDEAAEPKATSSKSASSKGGKAASASGGLIEPRTASELIARLKQFPRSDVDALLAEFRVKRVRDLKASQLPAVQKALDELEAALRPASGEDDDSVDPFA